MTALDELREMVERMTVCEDDPYVVGALLAVLACIDVVETRHSQEDDHGAV